MSKREYEWEPGGPPPVIYVHSLKKHEVLRAYLVRYLQILNATPNAEVFRLTLVDGFSGGGVYRNEQSGDLVYGSPFIFLQATREAEFLINQDRKKKLVLDASYFFVERQTHTLECLRQELLRHGYGKLIDQEHIRLLEGDFSRWAQHIITFIKNKGRAGRTIFLLDQYGYKDVPFPLLQNLFAELGRAEVILTFAIDAMGDYLSDNQQSRKLLEKLGLAHRADLHLAAIARSKGMSDRRAVIQRLFSSIIAQESGARFYTPFFISSRESNRDYWLVHLSMHERARDEMARLHWELHNHFSHNGGPGLDMLGYTPDKDPLVTGQSWFPDFTFSTTDKGLTVNQLREQLPECIIKHREGIQFDDLLRQTCNTTPASSDHYREALDDLLSNGDIVIKSPDGITRRKGASISKRDIISRPTQLTMFLPSLRRNK